MKIQKLVLPVILTLVTGCSFISRMTEPYETRYFTRSNVQSNLNNGYLESNEDFNKQCKGVRFFSSLGETEKNIIVMQGPNLSEIDTKTPYHIVAEKGDDRYLASDSDRYLVRLPVTTLEKCTVTEDVHKSNVEKERKKAIAKKEAAKKEADERKRKAEQKKAEKKQKAEQEAAEKNNNVIKKYGKPYCNPYTAEDILTDDILNEIKRSFFEKKKSCLFRADFTVLQVTSDGMLVTGKLPISLFEILDGPFFVIKHKDDFDKVDGEPVRGLFEYVGNYSYEAITGTKTVLKFKHVE